MSLLIVVVDLACLNDLKLVSTIFSLKATTPQMATSWIEGIQQAQVITLISIMDQPIAVTVHKDFEFEP